MFEALLHRFGGEIGLYLHLIYTSSSQLEKLYDIGSESCDSEIVAERHVSDVIEDLEEQHGENWWRDEFLYPFLDTIPRNVSRSARNGLKYPIDR